MELTFGEQIKIILKRKNMTIRQLAELIEVQTGRPMSRQNLTQKLNRDNFQEQDMKEIAQALGCFVQISVIDPMEATVASLQSMMPSVPTRAAAEEPAPAEERAAAAQPEPAAPKRETGPLAGRTARTKGPEAELKTKAGIEAEEDDVDSDVLREIELALMESIQKEFSGSREESTSEEPVRVNAKWQEEAHDGWSRQQKKLEEQEAAEDGADGIEAAAPEERRKEESVSGGAEAEPVVREEEEEFYWKKFETETDASYEQETESEEAAGSGTEEPDKLSWAQKRPAVWPRLIVPADTPAGVKKVRPEEEPEAETEEETGVPADGEEEADASRETEAGTDREAPTDFETTAEEEQDSREFAEDADLPFGGDDLDDFEFFELEELSGGDISGVSAPYTLKREESMDAEADGGKELPEEEVSAEAAPSAAGEEAPIDYSAVSSIPGGDVSYVSAPYVIPREESKEPEKESFYGEIPMDELPQVSVDDSEDTVQEYGEAPQEPDMGEKLAAWDAAAKRSLGKSIFLSAEERRAKRAAREAEEAKAKAAAEESSGTAGRVPAIDPRTGLEYETNTVKHHPTKPDMLLVYDQEEHMWVEQAERAFNNFQIRKRAMLGKDYEPPVYLD